MLTHQVSLQQVHEVHRRLNNNSLDQKFLQNDLIRISEIINQPMDILIPIVEKLMAHNLLTKK